MSDLPVHGYQPHTDGEIDLVKRNRIIEEKVLRILDSLAEYESVDKRWLAISRTHIEQGFMAANRAIFKPARIAGVIET